MITDVDHHKNINKNWNFQTRDFQWNLTISNKFMKKYIMKPFTVIFWPTRPEWGYQSSPSSSIWRFQFLFYWIINNLDTRQGTVGGPHFSSVLTSKDLDIKHLLGWIWFNFQTIPSFCPLYLSLSLSLSPLVILRIQSCLNRPCQGLIFSIFCLPDLDQNMMDWGTIK